MGQIGELTAAVGAMSLAYAERLVKDVRPQDFARFARPGGVEVRSNHPAFVLGHLALYPAKVLQHLGQPAGAATCPPAWEALFRNGVECHDDAAGTRYPPADEITARFFVGGRAALDALRHASDAALTAPNPAEGRMRELFPMLGAMLAFYVTSHVQMHLGQVSAWRRMMGMPAA